LKKCVSEILQSLPHYDFDNEPTGSFRLLPPLVAGFRFLSKACNSNKLPFHKQQLIALGDCNRQKQEPGKA
jgi:hypothetical protein